LKKGTLVSGTKMGALSVEMVQLEMDVTQFLGGMFGCCARLTLSSYTYTTNNNMKRKLRIYTIRSERRISSRRRYVTRMEEKTSESTHQFLEHL
jgi:hypothetical protein